MNGRKLARSLLAGWFALVTHAGVVSAGQITVTPAAPTSSDSIHIVVNDGFSMGCWDVVATSCTTVAPDSVIVTADIQYCGGQPSCFCTLFPEAFQVACDFAPLPPGTYRAVYRERYLNPADPRDQAPQALVFTVGAPTPALRRSWGKLKAIYR